MEPQPTLHQEHVFSIPDPFVFFSEKDNDLLAWKTHMQLKMNFNKGQFPTEAHKLIYAYLRTGGLAQKYLFPYFKDGTVRLPDMKTFYEVMEMGFGYPNRALLAYDVVSNRGLKQGNKSLTEYIANFRVHACFLDWSDELKQEYFHIGLARHMKDRSIPGYLASSDFEESVAACQRVEALSCRDKATH